MPTRMFPQETILVRDITRASVTYLKYFIFVDQSSTTPDVES